MLGSVRQAFQQAAKASKKIPERFRRTAKVEEAITPKTVETWLTDSKINNDQPLQEKQSLHHVYTDDDDEIM